MFFLQVSRLAKCEKRQRKWNEVEELGVIWFGYGEKERKNPKTIEETGREGNNVLRN